MTQEYLESFPEYMSVSSTEKRLSMISFLNILGHFGATGRASEKRNETKDGPNCVEFG